MSKRKPKQTKKSRKAAKSYKLDLVERYVLEAGGSILTLEKEPGSEVIRLEKISLDTNQ